MKISYLIFFCLLLSVILSLEISCNHGKAEKKLECDIDSLQIAVMADVHFQDVYGKFKSTSFKGVENPINHKMATIRTMASQLKSTRIFNENYFAFLTALDDIVARGIKLVILPGDFLDDGQPIHIRGLKEILHRYTKNYGIQFFLITGNHDVVEPFTHKAGKIDFFGINGKSQPIMSQSGMYVSNPLKEHEVVVTDDIKNLGYLEVTDILGDFGFFPKKNYLYWETPFSNYDYNTYTFEKAKEKSLLKFRKHSNLDGIYSFPDISYLVEPVEGLWLLALDANVFISKKNKDSGEISYPGVGLGYNNVIDHKQYLINWVQKVSQQAKKYNKTLITFSHYPMVDFNDGASIHIKNLKIENQMQLERNPKEEVSRSFADAGIKLHFGGHMHLNDTGIYKTEKGNTLINIQTPSLAAYKPAYKLATLVDSNIIDIETIIIDSVPRYNELFDLYNQEYAFLKNRNEKNIWNNKILTSSNYGEFTNWHLKELVRLRFLPAEWPPGFINFFTSLTGKELLVISQNDHSMAISDLILKLRQGNIELNALKKAKAKMQNSKGYEDWSGFDFLFDIYRFRSADHLAANDIGTTRIAQYNLIIDSFLKQNENSKNKDPYQKYILELMHLFKKFMNGEPSNHIKVNLSTGTVTSITK